MNSSSSSPQDAHEHQAPAGPRVPLWPSAFPSGLEELPMDFWVCSSPGCWALGISGCICCLAAVGKSAAGEAQNYRIMEWLGLQGTSKTIWFQSPGTPSSRLGCLESHPAFWIGHDHFGLEMTFYDVDPKQSKPHFLCSPCPGGASQKSQALEMYL